MSTENSFIPEDYKPPTGGGGFTKLQDGENRLRILSSPLMMWIVWKDGQASRVPFNQPKPIKGEGQKDSVKHGWGLIVWNYATESIEVFELDKQDIIAALTSYSKDPDWGHPKNYDIVVNKSGSGMETEYKFIAKPAKPLAEQVKLAYTENPIDLSQLLVANGNPFLSNGGSAKSTAPVSVAQKEITPDNWVEGDAIPQGYKVENGKLVKGLPF